MHNTILDGNKSTSSKHYYILRNTDQIAEQANASFHNFLNQVKLWSSAKVLKGQEKRCIHTRERLATKF